MKLLCTKTTHIPFRQIHQSLTFCLTCFSLCARSLHTQIHILYAHMHMHALPACGTHVHTRTHSHECIYTHAHMHPRFISPEPAEPRLHVVWSMYDPSLPTSVWFPGKALLSRVCSAVGNLRRSSADGTLCRRHLQHLCFSARSRLGSCVVFGRPVPLGSFSLK